MVFVLVKSYEVDCRTNRFALKKTKEGPRDMTEWEIRKSQDYNRIWDCGNLKYNS